MPTSEPPDQPASAAARFFSDHREAASWAAFGQSGARLVADALNAMSAVTPAPPTAPDAPLIHLVIDEGSLSMGREVSELARTLRLGRAAATSTGDGLRDQSDAPAAGPA